MLIPVMIGVTLLVFLMVHLIPGDPAQVMLGEKASHQEIERLREEMGLNDPLYVQYFSFVSRLLRGDLGRSIMSNNQISAELKHRYPATLELTLFSIVIAVLVGVPAGIISATNQYSIFDYISMTGALIGVSMPIFWLGLMLMWIFAFQLGWFPPSGRLSVGIELQTITNFHLLDAILTGNWIAFKDALSHLVLPGIALATIPMAMIARMTRSGMLEVLSEDYIKTARAKGLKERVVIYKHAFRNALVTVITVIGLQFGILLGGAVLTETIFSWPGIGKYLYDSIMARDYPAVQGTIFIFSFAFVLVNLIVDLLYAVIDPKIRYS